MKKKKGGGKKNKIYIKIYIKQFFQYTKLLISILRNISKKKKMKAHK